MQGVQAAVDAHADVMVAAVLAVAGDLPHDFGQFVVVRKDGPAVAVAAQGFAGEEAGACNRRQVAAFAAFVGCAKALGRVFNDGDAVFRGDGVDGVKVGALAVQAHGHDGFGSWGDGGFEPCRVQVVGAGVDVHIHGFGPQQGHGLGGGDVGKARGDDFVARANVQRHLRNLQRVGAVGHGDAVLGPGVSGQLFFQLGHFGAKDVLAVVKHALYARVNLGFEALVLSFEVDEVHGLGSVRRGCFVGADRWLAGCKPGRCGGRCIGLRLAGAAEFVRQIRSSSRFGGRARRP